MQENHEYGFVTQLYNSREHEPYGGEWEFFLEQLSLRIVADREKRSAQRSEQYGARQRSFSSRLLMPAGGWRIYTQTKPMDETAVMAIRQLEVARNDLPDLYQYTIRCEYRKSHEDAKFYKYSYIFEQRPATSPEEAWERFQSATKERAANQLCGALGDKLNIRVFALAVLPKAIESITSVPMPGMSELAILSNQLVAASQKMLDVRSKWQDTDALRFIDKNSGYHHFEKYRSRLNMFIEQFGSTPTKRGRRIKGGREHLVARTIASLWGRCGIGDVTFSAQSRFIKACSIVLPWHGIHKSDVSQFMRSECAKQELDGVLLD